MVNPELVPAIREAIKQNEIGTASPYCLSYARLGASGASFGIFQGDTNVNHRARDTLRQALQQNGAAADAINRIMAAVSQPCPNGNPLDAADTALTTQALDCSGGRALVDAQDQSLLGIVLGELDSCIAAAATRTIDIADDALLYIALWVNMTGAPDTLCKWLSGTQEVGLAPPAPPTVTAPTIEAYLQANSFFRLHPQNFVHMQDSVAGAVPLLPAATAAA